MVKPTLQEIFGANASQTSTTITITKADLTGLTASSNNTGESLLVAINSKAKGFLSQTSFDANIDQSTYLDNGFSSFTTRGTNNTSYRVDQIIINLAKIDLGATIDPDDY